MAKLSDDSIKSARDVEGPEATKKLEPTPVPETDDVIGETFSMDGETEVVEWQEDEVLEDDDMDAAFEPSDIVYGAIPSPTVNVNPPVVNIPAPVVNVDVPEAQIVKDDERHIKDKYRIAIIGIIIVIVVIAVALFAVNMAHSSEEQARADAAAAAQKYEQENAAKDANQQSEIEKLNSQSAEEQEKLKAQAQADADASAAEIAARDAEIDEMKSAHTHDWTIVMKTINHDEVNHDVVHPAVYEDVITYHSVCNECGEIIDGKAAQHIAETGHSGYSRNVPRTDKVLVSERWVETVVDAEAWVENVADHMVCTTCGEVKPLDDSMKSTMD